MSRGESELKTDNRRQLGSGQLRIRGVSPLPPAAPGSSLSAAGSKCIAVRNLHSNCTRGQAIVTHTLGRHTRPVALAVAAVEPEVGDGGLQHFSMAANSSEVDNISSEDEAF